MAFMLNKDGAFLVKGSGDDTVFCSTCCNGKGGKYTYEVTSASVQKIDSSWYTASLYGGGLVGFSTNASDEQEFAEIAVAEATIRIDGCDTEAHYDCGCNGRTVNGSTLSGSASSTGLDTFTATFKFDACPGVYGGDRDTHQLVINFAKTEEA